MPSIEQQIRQRLEFAKYIAVKAGKVVLEMQGGVMSVEQKEEGLGDIVTAADTESQRIIVEATRENFPEDDIDSEEKLRVLTGARFKYVWDPLDATLDYKTNGRQWGVSGGIHLDGEPVAGVVYFPRLHLLYMAQKGHGAFIQEGNSAPKRIHTASETKLVDGTFAYNYPYLTSEAMVHRFITPVFSAFRGKTGYVHVPPCVTLAVCFLAEGAGPLAMINGNVTPYDVGATKIILEEAGGIMSPVDWNKKRQPVLAAANREVYNEVLEMSGPKLLRSLRFTNDIMPR